MEALGTLHYLSISAGLARYPEHGATPDLLFKNAGLATHEAKRRGHDQLVGFSPDFERAVLDRHAGNALTFFTPREIGRLRAIERATRNTLEQITPPTAADVAAHKATRVLEKAVERLGGGTLAHRGSPRVAP